MSVSGPEPRDGFSWSGALFRAATWGVGVAAGVALGSWLTVVGGAGAPGLESIDPGTDLLMLPAAAGGAMFALQLAGGSAAAAWRAKRRRRHRSGS